MTVKRLDVSVAATRPGVGLVHSNPTVVRLRADEQGIYLMVDRQEVTIGAPELATLVAAAGLVLGRPAEVSLPNQAPGGDEE